MLPFKEQWRQHELKNHLSFIRLYFCLGVFFSQCEKTFDFLSLFTLSLFRSLRFAWTLPPELHASSPLNKQVPWLNYGFIWKCLSIMPWSDYLVVRLLTHSHHYIIEGSLWNYSTIYHSLLHGPYTLNDRLPLHTRYLTHPVENSEYRISPGKPWKVLTARNWCRPFICQLMCTQRACTAEICR